MKNKKMTWVIYVFFAWIIMVIMACVSSVYANQPLLYAFSFSFFQIFAILIPGLGYTRLLQKDKNISGIEVVFISYVLGYSSNIIMYYLLALFGGIENLAIGYFVLIGIQCIISIYLLYKEKKCYYETGSNWYIPLIFIFVIFQLELFAYAGYNLLPPFTNANQVWSDIYYWIGNTVSLKLDYPPVNFRTLQENYSYHYFSSIQLAVESIVTGIPVAEISIYFSYIQAVIIIVGGLYCLLKRFTQRTVRICIFFFMLLFASGYEGITRVSYVSHMYLSQYGFDYGMGYMLFLILAVLDFFEGDFSWKNYFYTCIIFTLLVGIKATYACIGIVGIGCCCLFYLLKKDWKKSIIFGLSILVLFIVMYINVCNISGYSGGKEIVKWATFHWDVCENLALIRENVFRYDFIPGFILEIIFWFLFAILCNPCLFITSLVCVIVKIFKEKKFDYFDISCFVMLIVGISITLYMHMNGKSNVYFVMATYPVALLFIVRTIEKKVYTGKYIWLAFLIVMNIYGGNLFLNNSAYEPIREYYESGKERFNAISSNGLIEDAEYGISGLEYEALLYIREQVEKDEVVISINNREDNRNLTGIFSEHKMLNVGNDNILSLEEIAAEWNVRYLVASNDVYTKMKLEGKKLYENEQWCVVRIK